MDLQNIRWNLSKKEHLDCIKTALITIKSNYTKVSQQDLIHLTYEFILFKEFKKEQSKWIKKTNNLQDLQCIDILLNYFETESDVRVRQLIFDLIFSDAIYNSNDLVYKNNFITTLISYSISLQSKQTLESLTQWLQTNLPTKEEILMNNLFTSVIIDHFLLRNDTNLENLAQISPLFVSLFIVIIFNTLIKTHLKLKNLIVKNFLISLNSSLKVNHQLVTLIYTNSLFSTQLNPFPGILYLTILFPLEFQNDQMNQDNKSNVCEIIENLHLISLKLIQDIFNFDKTKATNKIEPPKILSLSQITAIESYLNAFMTSNESSLNLVLFNECLDRLAQVLQLCLSKQLLAFDKNEIKKLFMKYTKIVNNELFLLLF